MVNLPFPVIYLQFPFSQVICIMHLGLCLHYPITLMGWRRPYPGVRFTNYVALGDHVVICP